jgi:hypothetical protein
MVSPPLPGTGTGFSITTVLVITLGSAQPTNSNAYKHATK